ncbi:4-alpha-glucanotransferase [Neomegalonema sp.]|uniref:4-alpha-glucanotransferase n=1 Tax=Neomegalonema sp. TaxID=2039713 RepID=UPI00260868C3|nr:4-alpha-glucanotransferase [Neomegalonema sp.]MDD2868718.1 4-alpha-glucanotransferase [Neomegalonema sp.]
MSRTALDALCDWIGLTDRFTDSTGLEHVAPDETRRAILAALGLAAETEDEARDRLAGLETAEASRLAPPTLLASAYAPLTLDPRVRRWRILCESGEQRRGEGAVRPSGLPVGRHEILLEGAGREDRVWLLVPPPEGAPSVKALTGRARLWGATGALYGLRSARDGGLGDFADLGRLAEILAEKGASFLGINPVHMLGSSDGGLFAPYSPSSRRAVNAAHVALDLLPEWASLPEALRNAPPPASGELIDYRAVHAWRAPRMLALYKAFAAEASAERRQAFADWRQARGEALERMALYEAIAETHGPSWPTWPEALRRPESPEALAFARSHAHVVSRQAFWLWIAETQLAEAQARAKAAGMALGLYLDLAVGVRPDGAETWADPDSFLRGVSLGAPPDALGPTGQRWGLAPFDPLRARATGYAALTETLRASMRGAGVLRIDHMIGYDRSFWLPEGLPGAYLRQPLAELLAVAAIEAHRARCAVVGEDLGLLPEGLRESLAGAGLMGYRLALFERGETIRGGEFLPPESYPEAALAAFSTHDLPTLAGWRRGREIDWRAKLGDITPEAAALMREERAHERWRFAEAVAAPERVPILGEEPEGHDLEAAEGAHGFLARTPCALAAVQLEDLLLQIEQPNLPGDVDRHPNWRRRIAASLEEIAGAPGVNQAAALMAAAGRSGLETGRPAEET